MESGDEEFEESGEGELLRLDEEFGDKILLLLFCFRPFIRILDDIDEDDEEEREVFESVNVEEVGNMVVVLISLSEPLFEPGGVGGKPGDINSEESRLEELDEEEEDDVGELTLLFNKAARVKFFDALFEFDPVFDEDVTDLRFPLKTKLLPI